MSAVDTIRDALYGNPPTPGFKPSRDGVLAGFTELFTQVVAATNGMVAYTTKALMNAAPIPANGTQERVYADPTPANNGVYVTKAGVRSLDVDFYSFLVSIVQTSVTAASDAATLAGHFANDSTDVAVPGQGDATARGAKYWSIVAGTYASAFAGASDLLPMFGKITAKTAIPSTRLINYGKKYGVGGTNFNMWISTAAVVAATREDYLDSFYAYFNTALVGRTIEFYILRPGTGLVIWRSGLIPCETAGLFTWNAPLAVASIMMVGDIGGWLCSAVGTDGIVFETTTGFNSLRKNGTTRLAVGAAYVTGTTADTIYRPIAGFITRSEAIILNTTMINTPYGIPDLDANSRLRIKQVPKVLIATDAAALGTTESVYEHRTMRTRRLAVRRVSLNSVYTQWFDGADSEDVPVNGSVTTLAITQQWPHITWFVGGNALNNPGVLTSIELSAGGLVGAGGGSIQVWHVRQPVLPDTGTLTIPGEAFTFLGEIPIPNATGGTITYTDYPWLETPAIDILTGDAIMIRGINVGIPFGTSNVAYNNDRYVRPNTYADLSITAFDVVGITTAISTGLRVPMRVTTRPGSSALSQRGKSGNLALDHQGYIPPYIGRKVEMPLRDKVVIFTGTSIEAGEAADSPAPRSGHVWKMIEALQCNGFNEGVGSSRVCFTNGAIGTDNISLGATKAELFALTANHGYDLYSYEAKVIDRIIANPGQDIYWFDMHGFNDAGNSTIGLITDTPGPATYYAAKRRMYEAFFDTCYTYGCRGRLALATCTHEYQSLTVVATRRQINAANRALADLYSAPILDVMAITGINPKTIARGAPSGATYPNGYLPDQVHPAQIVRDAISGAGNPFLKSIAFAPVT
jgi:hypothetical protein